MTVNDRCFMEWKEEFISQERGNRVVHYFLKDSCGDSVLAVVGTERSVRHMFYVVADDFLSVCGIDNSAQAAYKWRSRREVVDWLISMLSNNHNLPTEHDEISANKESHFLVSSETGSTILHDISPNYVGQLLRNLKGCDKNIMWSGVAWTCGKQLRHYPAFCRNGTTIVIQSFVFVMAKDDGQYVAYLEDMYEDKKGQQKVKVRWFHHNQEVKDVVHLGNCHSREIFITPYAQVISAECVDGPATVLTPDHYEKCLVMFPHASLGRIHNCFRQFRNNKVKPFDLRKLRGYFEQPIISCLGPNPICRDLVNEDEDACGLLENDRPLGKRARYFYKSDHFFISKPSKHLNSGEEKSNSLRATSNIYPHVQQSLNFTIGEKVEFLCQDSGIRGCWFRCTILEISLKKIKVQYIDLQDEDEFENLEEWIPAFRVAMPDKLGLRYEDRLTIRPCRHEEKACSVFDIGSAVDVWWSHGWWEGIVTSITGLRGHNAQVYFPGESFFLEVQEEDMRVSREWVRGGWDFLEDARPDILAMAMSPGRAMFNMGGCDSTKCKYAKLDGFSPSCHKTFINEESELGICEDGKVDEEGGIDTKDDSKSVVVDFKNGNTSQRELDCENDRLDEGDIEFMCCTTDEVGIGITTQKCESADRIQLVS